MVARRSSFTRAAEELHLTQPAVSAHVRKLERSIGGPLFEQIGRRVSLTATGQVVYRYAEQMMAQTVLAPYGLSANVVAVQQPGSVDVPRTVGHML